MRALYFLSIFLIFGCVFALAQNIGTSGQDKLGASVKVVDCPNVRVTDVSWQIAPYDTKYVCGISIRFEPTDNQAHTVDIYIILRDAEGNILQQDAYTQRYIPTTGLDLIVNGGLHLDAEKICEITIVLKESQ